KLARETKALADAAGIAIEDAPPLPVASMAAASDAEAARLVEAIGRRYRDTAPEHRMSAQQDALRGRPLELEETLGFALQRAAELGVPMPALTLAYAVLQASFAAIETRR
ncbi:MAG TPA: ketopantoate reductase C-terminal domain-containing protein, partial [Polyangiaceae bacterium]|nr:ketopantoate reductase C-terminal domain-containing protein [Polyangiaceae bacterium]